MNPSDREMHDVLAAVIQQQAELARQVKQSAEQVSRVSKLAGDVASKVGDTHEQHAKAIDGLNLCVGLLQRKANDAEAREARLRDTVEGLRAFASASTSTTSSKIGLVLNVIDVCATVAVFVVLVAVYLREFRQ